MFSNLGLSGGINGVMTTPLIGPSKIIVHLLAQCVIKRQFGSKGVQARV